MRVSEPVRAKRVLALGALLLALLCAVAASPAFARTGKPFSATVRAAAIDFEGAEYVFVGEVTSKQLGNGAVVYSTRGNDVTGRRTAKLRIWTPLGRINAKVLSIFSTQADGTVRNDGVGVITGGTGRYREAVGHFEVLAKLDPAQPDKTVFRMRKGRILLGQGRRPTPQRPS
jgi:hypothetical protein